MHLLFTQAAGSTHDVIGTVIEGGLIINFNTLKRANGYQD
jgi:hypothetical protein